MPPRYVMIASNAYSGSTLLSYLLGQHPEVATVSDVSGTRRKQRMSAFRCSCGRLMREDPFWLEIRSRMRNAGYLDFELNDFQLGFDRRQQRLRTLRTRSLRWTWLESLRNAAFRLVPGDESRMRDTAQRTASFARAVLDVMGGTSFVDASKERMRVSFLARHLPMELRVIHLVRDPRAVAHSTLRHRSHRSTSLREAARRWSRTNQTIVRQLDLLPPEQSTRVHYEELCRDPERTVGRLLEFCGVSPQPDRPLRNEGDLHLLGNERRLASFSEIRLDERWRSHLSPTEERAVLEVAEPIWRRLRGPQQHNDS